MKYTVRKTMTALALAFGTLAAASAQAGNLVTDWNFTIDAAFAAEVAGGTVFGSGNGTTSVGDQQISWGATGGGLGLGSTRSSLTLGNNPSGTNGLGGLVTNNLAGYNTLNVTHTNNILNGNNATLLSTVIYSTLFLTPFTPSGPTINPGGFTLPFAIEFSETSNSAGNCAVTGAGASVCDDIFVLTSGLLNSPFTYDGYDYFLNIKNLGGNGLIDLASLPANVCAAAGADPGCLGFTTNEEVANKVQFAITITSKPLQIPEPGSLALIGVALAGLGMARRRRS